MSIDFPSRVTVSVVYARALYLRAMGGAHVIISALYIPAASGCYFDVFTFLPSLLKRIKLSSINDGFIYIVSGV